MAPAISNRYSSEGDACLILGYKSIQVIKTSPYSITLRTPSYLSSGPARLAITVDDKCHISDIVVSSPGALPLRRVKISMIEAE